MELQPIVHVWIHSDNDLVDLTIITPSKARHGTSQTTIQSEVVHTNQKHPFLTKEQGFLAVGKISIGMHILRANGHVGVVTGWKVVPGVMVMYNLEVAQDHTFTVGDGQWIVHNLCSGKDINFDPKNLQHTYNKHASDFGITDNWNKANGQKFEQTIRDFVDAPTTVGLPGTYRGNPVTHFFDPSTHQDVMIDPYNNLVAAWQLDEDQVHYLLTYGNVQ
jgi:Colicin D/Pretoxin HINT domain